jgi:hypothetical protein
MTGRTMPAQACLSYRHTCEETFMLSIALPTSGSPRYPWLADESPLNDLDDAESDTELDDGDTLPDEVLEQLEKEPPPPDPMPDPGVM